MQTTATAAEFVRRFRLLSSGAAEPGSARTDRGPQMGQIFALAKEFIDMPVQEIELLLERPEHGLRVEARRRDTPASVRAALYELYIRRHDRIDNWDLVDRSAPYVVGGYLFDKPRERLYLLARSSNQWERRTAIVATYFFIRQGDLDDTFHIAEILVNDEADLVRKAVGGWVREAGKRDPERLLSFLDKHAATMPRTTLRYAVEHLPPETRQHYMGLRAVSAGAVRSTGPAS
jgi:DNA alkylation repair enzyme